MPVEFPTPAADRVAHHRGTAKFPGIKIHDTGMIRLMEILLHGGTQLAGWRSKQIHQALLTVREALRPQPAAR